MTGATPSRPAAHVFVTDLEHPELTDVDCHHLERVLRLRQGESVTASDGQGGLRACTFAAGGALEPTGGIEREPERPVSIGIGFALVKGERPEWIVQKLTECGVDRILPFVAERSIIRWDAAKADRNLARLRRIATEAAMQSRRRWLPVVAPVAPFVEVVRDLGGVARADFEGSPPDPATTTLLIGPEGGWTEHERATLQPSITLGPTVLRSETAAMAAGVLLTSLRAGLVQAAAPRAPRS